jgi:hypothetical protein
VREAAHAFDVLRGVLRKLYGTGAAMRAQVDLPAMFIWSTMHGLASITQANVMDCLKLAPKVGTQAPGHVMRMIEAAMRSSAETQAAARD